MNRTNYSSKYSRGSYASTSNNNSMNKRQEECQYNDIPEMTNFEEQLANWHLPKVKPSEIYSIGMFDLRMAMTIKTIEQTIPVNRDMETIQLLHKEELRRYFDKYKYVHLGMVQVAVKPLTAQGLNTSVLIALRDCRHLDFKDSLLGIIQTSLCKDNNYKAMLDMNGLSLNVLTSQERSILDLINEIDNSEVKKKND